MQHSLRKAHTEALYKVHMASAVSWVLVASESAQDKGLGRMTEVKIMAVGVGTGLALR